MGRDKPDRGWSKEGFRDTAWEKVIELTYSPKSAASKVRTYGVFTVRKADFFTISVSNLKLL